MFLEAFTATKSTTNLNPDSLTVKRLKSIGIITPVYDHQETQQTLGIPCCQPAHFYAKILATPFPDGFIVVSRPLPEGTQAAGTGCGVTISTSHLGGINPESISPLKKASVESLAEDLSWESRYASAV